ncbi:plakophilin-1 [Menidia menidia]
MEPLRSATGYGLAEDTSLALPSDNTLSSGRQRVLNQVGSMKRSKSRRDRDKNGTLSPATSPTQEVFSTYNEFGGFKFSPTKANGHYRGINSVSSGTSKMRNSQWRHSASTRNTSSRHFSSSGILEYELGHSNLSQAANGLKTSRSDPALVPPGVFAPAPSMRAKGQVVKSPSTMQAQGITRSTHSVISGVNLNRSQTLVTKSPVSLPTFEGKMGTFKASKVEQTSAMSSALSMPNISLEEAVNQLSLTGPLDQQRGATFIQHITYEQETAKAEVLRLGGVQHLVALLKSTQPEVSQAAAGALRNLCFKEQENKLAVQSCDGIPNSLQLLQNTDSTETQKQITGLLWNLSSTEALKNDLIKEALPVLAKHVVIPFTCGSDDILKAHIDPSVFHNATGCLRNLSSGPSEHRMKMRKCDNLIRSLISYIQSCVAEEKPDDESVENCACILHNLTYHLEDENPESFSHYNSLEEDQSERRKSPTVGCFSPRSSKAQKLFSVDNTKTLSETNGLSDISLLCHPKTMDVYLALLSSSKNPATLEASCGALQNLTASKEQGSAAVSEVLAKKLDAMFVLPLLLKSSNKTLHKITISLLDNMSRTSSVQAVLGKPVLADLIQILLKNVNDVRESDELTATVCNIIRRLMLANSQKSKTLIDGDLLELLNELRAKESFPKCNRAASVLLYSMWNDKTLQNYVKKFPGMSKSFFINQTTQNYVKESLSE